MWYFTEGRKAKTVEKVALDYFQSLTDEQKDSIECTSCKIRTCQFPLQHRMFWPNDDFIQKLKEAGVKVYRIVTKPGDLVLIDLGSYHWGFNLTPHALNVAGKKCKLFVHILNFFILLILK